MKATGYSLALAAVLAAAWSVVGTTAVVAQSPGASASATLFRDLARRENPAVVSIVTRSRSRESEEGAEAILRYFELDPRQPGSHVHLAAGSGFVISSIGDILTNNHVVEGAERIEVSLFGDDRKPYRAILVGGDRQTDSALIRLQNPPPHLQAATLGDSDALEAGDWVMAIGNPFQLGHSVMAGIISFPQRPIQVQDGRWQDLIQVDASINTGSSGGPLFNLRGEVVGVNVAMLDGNSGANVGIGFAVPINTVKALLPQLRTGKVVRGQLGVQLHGGPILHDEAIELRLPTAAGAIVMKVDADSGAQRAGLRAGDVIVAIDGRKVAHTRDLIARTASMTPGTHVAVKIFRDGQALVRTVTIDEQFADPVEQTPAGDSDRDDGLTLDEATASRGALVVNVALDSAADDAELVPGDVVRAINGRRIRTLEEARCALRGLEPGRPAFLLVSRGGMDVFLEMRRR
jgi:serine protease Do